LINNLIDRN